MGILLKSKNGGYILENIKYLEIVFENIESIVVPIEQIKSFHYGNLTPIEHSHYGKAYISNNIELRIEFNSVNDLEYIPSDYDEPLGMFFNNPTSNNVSDRPNILGRVLHNDVTMIEMWDENEHVIKPIYVPWGNSEYENDCMTTSVDGNVLIIKITEQ